MGDLENSELQAKSKGFKSVSAAPNSRGEFFIDGYPVRNYGYSDRKRPNGYRTLKLLLVEKYGVCYHCGKPVKVYPQRNGYSLPPDNATIDHLSPRPHGRIPGRKRHEIVEKVLACNQCNTDLNTRHATWLPPTRSQNEPI